MLHDSAHVRIQHIEGRAAFIPPFRAHSTIFGARDIRVPRAVLGLLGELQKLEGRRTRALATCVTGLGAQETAKDLASVLARRRALPGIDHNC